MNKSDPLSALAWAAVGILFCKGSVSLGLGSLGEPGPGFFPFIMSIFLISFSLLHILSSLTRGRPAMGMEDTRWPGGDGIRRIVLSVIPLFGFVMALDGLGFVLTTLLFMLFVSSLVIPQKKSTVFLTTMLTTIMSYIVFEVWLKAHLPKGFLGF